ncbi:MAG: hypothetical protein EXS46_02810 [Candidatus Taylorbacteria bacterium]|nr:hypothetical protein [Candidatus Taylorbacteria bacterium]
MWKNLHFVATPNLSVFEVRGTQLFRTGASSLIQSILLFESGKIQALGDVDVALGSAADYVSAEKFKEGLEFVVAARLGLYKMLGLKDSKAAEARKLKLKKT